MTDEIVIRFTAQQLDCVANALGHRPYIESAPVIEAIRAQVAQQQPGSLPGNPPPNGPHPDASDSGNTPGLQ